MAKTRHRRFSRLLDLHFPETENPGACRKTAGPLGSQNAITGILNQMGISATISFRSGLHVRLEYAETIGDRLNYVTCLL